MNFDKFLSTLPDPVQQNIREAIKLGSSFTSKVWITAQEADDKIERLMPLRDLIADKFKSGNSVPIERITLRREEIEQLVFGVEYVDERKRKVTERKGDEPNGTA